MSTITHNSHNPLDRLAADHPWFVKAGRVGWSAKRVIYVVAGILAPLIAAKSSGSSTSSTSGTQQASPTGFVAYGLFCLTTFTHRRLEAP